MSPLARGPVDDRRVDGHPVIPDDNGAWRPLDASLVVDTARDMCVQESEEGVALLLLQPDNAASEAGVDEKCLLAAGWVGADDWVLVGDRLAAHDASALAAELGLLDARVDSLEAVQSLLERWREAVVSLGLVDESSVTTGLGGVEDVEESGSRWLCLVGDIRVPRDAAVAAGEELVDLAGLAQAVDKMYLWVALWCAGGWVDVVATEVAAEVEGILDREIGEVLVAEGDDLALSDKEGELGLASL